MNLFHAPVELLVEVLAQQNLGIISLSGRDWDGGYQHNSISRRRSLKIQQWYVAVARCLLRDRGEAGFGRELKAESEVGVDVARGRKVGLLGEVVIRRL